MFERARGFAQSLPRPSRVIVAHAVLVVTLIGYGVAFGALGLALGYAAALVAGIALAINGRTGVLFALDLIVFLVAAIPAFGALVMVVMFLASGAFGVLSVVFVTAAGLPAALSVVGLRALRDQERGRAAHPNQLT